jgi:hypothetical protein
VRIEEITFYFKNLLITLHFSISEGLNSDYSIPTLWYHGEDIPANNELIFEEHIPIYLEEEVVTEGNFFENVIPTTNSTLTESKPKNNTLTCDLMKANHRDVQSSQSGSRTPHTPKTPSSANFKPFVLNEHTMRIFKNKIKAIQKRRAQALAREKKQRPKKIKSTSLTTPTSNKVQISSKSLLKITNFRNSNLHFSEFLSEELPCELLIFFEFQKTVDF